jgi:glycosyltransferase involved in cell wall biosynthesis
MTDGPNERRDALRVALVTETYPPEINGVAMTVGRLVTGLLSRGHTVHLVRPRQHAGERPVESGQLTETLVRGIPIPRYESLKAGLPTIGVLHRAWSQVPPDVVHIVTEGPLGWSASNAARRLRIPVSTGLHTNFHSYSGHYGLGWMLGPIYRYLRWFHNRAACTMVPTESLKAELEADGFERLAVVSRGVDTALFNPRRRSEELRVGWGARSGSPVAMYTGRLAPEKNLGVVLAAYDAMRASDPSIRLVLVGDGPERGRLEVSRPDVVFAGMRRGVDLAAHYASADVFLFPSLTETFGNVTLEAMASGLAVVAFDYAAAAEHIRHDESGLRIPIGDTAGFVAGAVSLASDADRACRLRAGAWSHARRIDWDNVVGDFETCLRRVSRSEPDPARTARPVAGARGVAGGP